MFFHRGILLKLGISFLVVAALIAALTFWPRTQTNQTAEADWTCPMPEHQHVSQSGPGQCPLCGMDLVPRSQLTAKQAALKNQSGLETEEVAYRELFKEIRTVGKLDYNERRVAYLTARIAGRVDRLYADFAGISVKQGDHLADIYSPDLFVAQDELIRAGDALKKAADPADREAAARLLEATRTKLRLWGMLPEQITDIETARKVRTHLTIYAPIGGTIIEKAVRAGQYVKEGDMLYRIADLDPLWLFLDIYEYDLGWIRYGQAVEVRVEAYPGEIFHGTITFIDPFLDDRTRSVKVRVNMNNSDRRLKPAMYASTVIRVRLRADGSPEPTGLEGKYFCPMHPEIVQDKEGRCPICEMPLERVPDLTPPAHPNHNHREMTSPARQDNKVLAVRASAVLDTGKRKVAYRETDKGDYELVELELGPRAEGKDAAGQRTSYFPVRTGLKPGDRVVIRGAALIDSQKQIEGKPSLLHPKGQAPAQLHGEHGGMAMPPPEKKEHQHPQPEHKH